MDETRRYLKHACVAWEKLRIVFNLVFLVQFQIAFRIPLKAFIQSHPELWLFVIVCFAFANACYCLGPLFEVYAWVVHGWRIGRARYLLFVAGVVFSILWFCTSH